MEIQLGLLAEGGPATQQHFQGMSDEPLDLLLLVKEIL